MHLPVHVDCKFGEWVRDEVNASLTAHPDGGSYQSNARKIWKLGVIITILAG